MTKQKRAACCSLLFFTVTFILIMPMYCSVLVSFWIAIILSLHKPLTMDVISDLFFAIPLVAFLYWGFNQTMQDWWNKICMEALRVRATP